MSRTVTLAQLKTDIAYQADIVIGSTGRYQASNITRLVNQSIQRFRDRITQGGIEHYLVSYDSTLTYGATSPYPFLMLDLSAVSPSIRTVYGFDVTIDGFTQTLQMRPFTQRDESDNIPARPRYWSQVRDGQIAVFPPPDFDYAYSVWYLPVLADLVSDSDTFDGVAGWEDYVVWDTVCRLIQRDAYPTAYQMAESERDGAWADILRVASTVSAAGPTVVGRDSLARTRQVRRDRDFWPRIGDTAPPWSPLDDNPLIWLDATYGLNVVGGNVAEWSSRVGGITVLQNTVGARPAYSATGWASNKPGVVFGGGGYTDLRATIGVSTLLASLNSFEMAATIHVSSAGARQFLVFCDNGTGVFGWGIATSDRELLDLHAGGSDIEGAPCTGVNHRFWLKRDQGGTGLCLSAIDMIPSIDRNDAAGVPQCTTFTVGGQSLIGASYLRATLAELVIWPGNPGVGLEYKNYSTMKWGG